MFYYKNMPRYFKTNIEKGKEKQLNFCLKKSTSPGSKNSQIKEKHARFPEHAVYQYIDKFFDAAVTCALVTIPIYRSLKRI